MHDSMYIYINFFLLLPRSHDNLGLKLPQSPKFLFYSVLGVTRLRHQWFIHFIWAFWSGSWTCSDCKCKNTRQTNTSRFLLTSYVGLIWGSTAEVTTSWSTIEGTLRICCSCYMYGTPVTVAAAYLQQYSSLQLPQRYFVIWDLHSWSEESRCEPFFESEMAATNSPGASKNSLSELSKSCWILFILTLG